MRARRRARDRAASSRVRDPRSSLDPRRPLPADDGPLDPRKNKQGQRQRQRHPQRGGEPERRRGGALERQDQRHDQVADQQDGEVGRRVVGAVLAGGEAAMGAARREPQEAGEQAALSAGGTTMAQSPAQGGKPLSRRGGLGEVGHRVGGVIYRSARGNSRSKRRNKS